MQALLHDSVHRFPAGQQAQSDLAFGRGPRLRGSADGRAHLGHLPVSDGLQRQVQIVSFKGHKLLTVPG